MIIYKITNTLNNKVYIGQTIKKLSSRWAQHIYESKNKSHRYLYRAIKKYGKENFKIETLCSVLNKDSLDVLEIQLIAENKSLKPNGYNLTPGGKNAPLLKSTYKKIANKNRNRVVSKETRLKQSLAKLGKKKDPAIVEKHSKWMIENSTWGYKPGNLNYRAKPIVSFCLKTGVINFYETSHKVDLTRFSPKSIWRVLTNKRKKYKNHFWRYATSEEIQNWKMKVENTNV